jgi:hypothetical protein
MDAGKHFLLIALLAIMKLPLKLKLERRKRMFKWDELDDLKKAAMDRDAFQEVLVYQCEQLLRELKSIGWKLKEIKDNGAL